MRTLLKISAFALAVCAGLMIVSLPDLSTRESLVLGSSPPAQIETSHSSRSGSHLGIQTTRLATGGGGLKIPQPGYLIITSCSPDAPRATIHISSPDSLIPDPVPWRELVPLTKKPSDRRLRLDDQPRRREARNAANAEDRGDSESGRIFHLHVTDESLSDPRQYVPVHCRPIAEGKLVRVYLDRQRKLTRRIERSAQQIIQTLEEQIIPRANREIGPWDDVDGDGRLAVLLTPWLEKLQGGKTSLKGFVRGSDFQPHYPVPFGNRADLIYVNSEIAGDVNYLTLLAHEYWHVLQCSYRLSLPDSPLAMDEDWINEGTAHLAEIRFGGDSGNLAHRIECWLRSPESAPLVVENYYSAGLWRDDGCRGATFLFFHWCEQHFGSDLGLRLLTSPRTGVRNLKQVTGHDLELLQTHWTVSMLRQHRLTDRPSQSRGGETLLAATRGFEHVKLDRLRIHAIGQDAGADAQLELAPTATCYVRIEPGSWKIETEGSSAVPLRITFVPEQSGEPLAGPKTAESDNALR